ncbi:MAG: hypothetical protein KKA64_03785 [Nanoarchaeota archaeon]|nr:hypothetical protein [Nanoarchaeota archaeon]
MKLINFDVKKFNNLKDKKWMLGNNILYKMCSDYPSHTDPEEIRAKILLIGRSYAASIERRSKINKKHINDDFYDYVVKEFIKFNSKNKFDEKLSKLKNKEFNEKTLKDILILHKELTKFFKELTGKEKRSLASKYLHFHVPIFPIYDSRANSSINKIVVGRVEDADFLCDEKYFKFCNKILFLYNYIKNNSRKAPTLREIDTFLIKNANDRLNKKKVGKR